MADIKDSNFSFKIYTRRWGHDDHYTITWTEEGWLFSGASTFLSGNCDKQCKPYLFKTMEHESVCYPYNVGIFFEELWEQAANDLSIEEVQNALNDIAEWINGCEMNTPRGIFSSLI